MKNFSLLIAVFMIMSHLISAQEYKIKVAGKKTLVLNEINKIEVEGYEGTEIVITGEVEDKRDEERTKGLNLINAEGLKDNTGIGLSYVEEGEKLKFIPLSKRSDREYKVKIPKNVSVVYEHSSSYGSTFKVKNVSGEIEASTNHSGIFLENITGPLALNTVHGSIDAIFTAVNQSNPISIVSTHGLIDVTIPKSTKANLKLSSNWGELYTDMSIQMDKQNDGMQKHSSEVSGKINGGGVTINLSSSHGNIYLRSK